MPQTKDYVKYGSKVGRVMFVARLTKPILCKPPCCGSCVVDDEYGPSRVFPNAGLAKAWLRTELPKAGRDWMGHIETGQYEDCSFTDPGYGHISDVTWEFNDRGYGAYASQDETGVVFDEWNV